MGTEDAEDFAEIIVQSCLDAVDFLVGDRGEIGALGKESADFVGASFPRSAMNRRKNTNKGVHVLEVIYNVC